MDDFIPRVVYRGAPDVLGRGPHVDPETGAIVGETQRVLTREVFDAALADGWRLTRELDAPVAPKGKK